jgi:hypothetical protein
MRNELSQLKERLQIAKRTQKIPISPNPAFHAIQEKGKKYSKVSQL